MFSSRTEMDEDIFTLSYPDSITSLMRAVRDGDLKKMKKLITTGSLPQTPDNRGWTALHYCVASNQLDALKLILKLKSKNKAYLVNLTTWDHVTPLLLALKAKPPSLSMVKVLLKAGASVKICTYTSISPLHLACSQKGNIEIVKLIVRCGADPNVQEEYGLFTPLHFAVCHSGDLEIIKYLVKISDLSLRNIFNRTAFLEACNSCFVGAIKIFLKKNKRLANISLGLPPLVYACSWGDVKMAKCLIEAGADVNVKCKALVPCDGSSTHQILLDSENFLPIHSALTNVELFKLLLDLTNPINIRELSLNYCNFPVHVLLYAQKCLYYETLLQSKAPNALKKVNCRVIINYITGFPTLRNIIARKFTLFFKYNFHLEPEDVFQNFVFLMTEEELIQNFEFLYILAHMGISSADEFSNKNTVMELLKNAITEYRGTRKCEMMKQTYSLLQQTVLPLKKICRIILRRSIWFLVENNWMAVKLVQDCTYLPAYLKDFIFFDVL